MKSQGGCVENVIGLSPWPGCKHSRMATLCVACKTGSDDDPSPHIDEGLAGTREDHKRMRGKQWGDMVQRSRGR